jgi:hypothetical protein
MATLLSVPYLDLTRARRRIAVPLAERWQHILEANAYVLGPEVRELERRFAPILGVEACIGVANGTDALVLALRALGVEPGDEVIVPAFSFFATAEAVLLAGGEPVFADVDPQTYNLDPRTPRRGSPRARSASSACISTAGRSTSRRCAGCASATACGWSRTPPRRTARCTAGGGWAASAAWRRGASIPPRTSAASATAAR